MSVTSEIGFYIVLGIVLFFVGIKIYDFVKEKAPGLFKKNKETIKPPTKPEEKKQTNEEYL